MLKLYKGLLKIILGFLSITLLTFLGVTTFVNPNKFKIALEQTVLDQTGRILVIKHPLKWELTPYPTLFARDITLKKPLFSNVNEADLLSIKEAKIEPSLWSLFLGKIFVTLDLRGLKVQLVKNADGLNNWTDIQKIILGETPLKNSEMNVVRLRIHQGSIEYNDLLNGKQTAINNIGLSTKNIHYALLGSTVPLRLYFEVPSKNEKGPGKGEVKTVELKAGFQLTENRENLNIQKLYLKLQQFEEGKSLDNILAFTGNIQIEGLGPTPNVQGKFSFGKTGTVNLSLATDLAQGFEKISLKGSLEGKDFSVGRIYFKDLKIPIVGKEGVIDCNPILFNMANSQQQAMLQINLRKGSPRLTFTQQGDAFELKDLFTQLKSNSTLEGKAKFKTTLQTEGYSWEEWRHNLSGHAEILITEGKLHGIDLPSLLSHAQATIKSIVNTVSQQQKPNTAAILSAELGEWKKQASNPANLVSPFDKLHASATITHGILYNPDLTLTHSKYTLDGQGSLDLNSLQLQYRALALLKGESETKQNNNDPNLQNAQNNASSFFAETPLSIHIKETVSNPMVNPDLEEYTHHAIKFVSKQNENQILQKGFEKLFETENAQLTP